MTHHGCERSTSCNPNELDGNTQCPNWKENGWNIHKGWNLDWKVAKWKGPDRRDCLLSHRGPPTTTMKGVRRPWGVALGGEHRGRHARRSPGPWWSSGSVSGREAAPEGQRFRARPRATCTSNWRSRSGAVTDEQKNAWRKPTPPPRLFFAPCPLKQGAPPSVHLLKDATVAHDETAQETERWLPVQVARICCAMSADWIVTVSNQVLEATRRSRLLLHTSSASCIPGSSTWRSSKRQFDAEPATF